MTDPHAVDPTAVLAFDNPEAYIARDRRRAMSEGRELPDRAHGAAVFADISGFTTVTEALAVRARIRSAVRRSSRPTSTGSSTRVIAELDRFGGDVIYFSGDAVTCWLDGDDGVRAAACGLAMQDAMARVGEVVTPSRNDRAAGDQGRCRRRAGAALRRRRPRDPADGRAGREPGRRAGRGRALGGSRRGRARAIRRSDRSATGRRSASDEWTRKPAPSSACSHV